MKKEEKIRQIRTMIFSIILIAIFLMFVKYTGLDKTFDKFVFQLKYEDLVEKYATEYNLDKYLIYAIIRAESGFDRYAVSNKGAKGLMQITDETAQWIADQIEMTDFVTENLFIPEINIKMGSWYLLYLLNHLKSTDLVISAYNAGIGKVNEWLQNEEYSSDGITLVKIPFIETGNYVKKVKYNYTKFKELYG